MNAPRRLSVLVVDDYPDAAESTADLCRLFGHAARFALGGEEGLALAAAGFHLHLVKPVPGPTLAGLLRRLQIALN